MTKSRRNHPDQADAWFSSGLSRQRAGDLEGALACYAKIPDRHPARADALHLSGIVHSQRGDPGQGEVLIAQAIALSPKAPIYRVNHANALEALGRPAAAELALRDALSLDPRFVPALYNLGQLLGRLDRVDEAIALLDQALVADPAHLNACIALAEMLQRRTHHELAHRVALKARALSPDSEAVSDLLIGTLLDTKRYMEAAAELGRRLATNPKSVTLLRGRAHALEKTGAYSEALATYRAALDLDPTHRDAALEMASTLVFMGQPDAAVATLTALCDRQGNPTTYSNLLFNLNYDDRLPAAKLRDMHRAWEALVEPKHPPFEHPATPRQASRIRVGYVSEDFKQHSVAWFIEHVLAAHDRDRFEVFAYFVAPDPDAVTERIRGKVDCFRDSPTKAMNEIADRMRADGIDIAIELSGHTSYRVLEVMTYRPAPVQISWLGYPNTTGVSVIDYRISDAIADPPDEDDALNTETVLRLPDCFHCYRPDLQLGFDPEPPVVRAGFVTFGSFNVLAKLSPACCDAWARIINDVPRSRLLLKSRALHDPVVRENILTRFAASGLSSERIKFMGDMTSWTEHMACYRDVDIALDPFPYNGTTTTCEALWMGVPVLTTLGDRHAGRVGASLLHAVGHPELVAPNREAYVSEAIRLGSDPSSIASLHRKVHADLLASPLCDLPRFVRNLEAAYESVWRRYCEAHH